MAPFFLRAAIAFVAAMAAIGLGLVAQWVVAAPYTAIAALWATFLVGIGVGAFLFLKKGDDPKVGPALGALFALGGYACVARYELAKEGEIYVKVVLTAAPMIALAGLVVGLVLEKFPRASVGFAAMMTAVASIAVTLPSLPHALWKEKSERPDASDVHSMTLAGVLVLDGAPIVAHGVSYRLQHDALDSTWCEVVAESHAPQFMSQGASVVYSCRSRALRCDDERRMCLVDDPDYATGYTYDYERIGIHGHREPEGRLAIRVEAWLLAVVAVVLLLKARASPLRGALAMGAMVNALIGAMMMVRYLDF